MSLIPDLYVYTGTLFTLSGIALIPQRRLYVALLLLVTAAILFATRIYLNRTELTVRDVWRRGSL